MIYDCETMEAEKKKRTSLEQTIIDDDGDDGDNYVQDRQDSKEAEGQEGNGLMQELETMIREKSDELSRLIRKRARLETDKIDEKKGCAMMLLSSKSRNIFRAENIKEGWFTNCMGKLFCSHSGRMFNSEDLLTKVTKQRSFTSSHEEMKAGDH